MKLVRGKGSQKEGACWMSALAWYSGEAWSDFPSCVGSMVVRQLCIGLNDFLRTNAEREKWIGPHLFTPLGTLGGVDREVKRVRLVLLAYTDIQSSLLIGVSETRGASLSRHFKNFMHVAGEAIRWRSLDRAVDAACHLSPAAISAWSTEASLYLPKKRYRKLRQAILERWLKLILDCCAIGEKAEVAQVRQLCELP